eukprot:CAMPEP_0179694026 /NCGR_PEP_ID=MMETSP0936-20121108/5563_1 /TAXON_ID=548131 ORGANISM="Ostreococcus mediterraneus, Strain clade-D-RCC2573" /NCGR_SAMPLE_ID=MMETSP0936 /ASSEMBLY_ACC=CAM_ASM_000574 /LENGTH=85 /DNA_ID=CAMNT_0021566779 /DNA_START=18 /DNA_END=272 /DNA_ORIENTATION=-
MTLAASCSGIAIARVRTAQAPVRGASARAGGADDVGRLQLRVSARARCVARHGAFGRAVSAPRAWMTSRASSVCGRAVRGASGGG